MKPVVGGKVPSLCCCWPPSYTIIGLCSILAAVVVRKLDPECRITQIAFAALGSKHIVCHDMNIAQHSEGCDKNKGHGQLKRLNGAVGYISLIFFAVGGRSAGDPRGLLFLSPRVPKLKPVLGFKIEAGNWLQ